mgnify:FL=1
MPPHREFVLRARSGALRHDYDLVAGPVLRNPSSFLTEGEQPVVRGTQVAFHTERAVRVRPAHLAAGSGAGTAHGNRFACRCGETHRGRHGAAGLLAWFRGATGADWFLLQRRSRGTDLGGTWGCPVVPGSGERTRDRRSPGRARGRSGPGRVRGPRHLDRRPRRPVVHVLPARLRDRVGGSVNRESTELRWVRREDVRSLDLHPDLAAA